MADFPKEIKELEYVDENVKVKTKIDKDGFINIGFSPNKVLVSNDL